MTVIDGVRSSTSALAATGVVGVDEDAWTEALAAAGSETSSARTGAIGGTVAVSSAALAAQESETDDSDSVTEEFLSWVHMDPVERMRAQILVSMNMTEEQLAALPEDERKRIEDKIRQIIEETVKRESEENSASSEQSVQQQTTAASGETAATAGQTGDGNDKTAQGDGEAPSQLEVMLPFLRADGGPSLGGTQAKASDATASTDAERRRDEAEAV